MNAPGAMTVAIDTRRVAGRPKLHFDNLEEMLAYPERLVSGGTTQLDPGIANGKAREATLARFALIAQGKVRPSEDGRYKSS